MYKIGKRIPFYKGNNILNSELFFSRDTNRFFKTSKVWEVLEDGKIIGVFYNIVPPHGRTEYKLKFTKDFSDNLSYEEEAQIKNVILSNI